ncbi:hypothetical protein PSPO01_00407 [Paraphaeosphaeria sporulosa]
MARMLVLLSAAPVTAVYFSRTGVHPLHRSASCFDATLQLFDLPALRTLGQLSSVRASPPTIPSTLHFGPCPCISDIFSASDAPHCPALVNRPCCGTFRAISDMLRLSHRVTTRPPSSVLLKPICREAHNDGHPSGDVETLRVSADHLPRRKSHSRVHLANSRTLSADVHYTIRRRRRTQPTASRPCRYGPKYR